MNLYSDVLESIKYNKKRRESGKLIAIPWTNLPKISKVLPGVIQENYTIISANQKVGKTQLADYLYLYSPIDWLYNNQHESIDVNITYFSLEMSKQAKMRQAMSYRLFTKYGILISPQDLRSIFEDYILENEIINLIEEDHEWFDFFQKKVTFYDDIRNPYGIYLVVKNVCESVGKYEYSQIEWKEDDGTISLKNKRDKYIPDNPDLIQEIIIDHASLILPEGGETPYDAIGRLSSRYILEMRDIWKCQAVLVQQQTPTSETQQYTALGGTVLNKIRPTADGLGYNKSTAQDANLMISLFHPSRYQQKQFRGIDLTQMNKGYREFIININRDGIADVSTDLYFNGICNHFEEINEHSLEETYQKIKKLKSKRDG